MNPNIPYIKAKQVTQPKKQLQRQDSFNQQYNENSQQSSKSFRSKDPVLENSPIGIDILRKDKHTKININNIDIYFPYQPYDVQTVYMENVIQCLEQRVHGLLESPTGTGKTLSMLCAALGWLQKRREQQIGMKDIVPNRIIYCSRTHSQIQQVVKEVKRTVYLPKIVVQGSREQYCIKKEFEQLKGGILNTACQKAISQLNQQTHCKFFKGSMEDGRDLFKVKMPDIEDLRTDGYNNNYCPFYHTQRVNNAVDVLFLPYNYLLDRNVMNQANINLKNAIVIFDEAHNIHKTAEEGYSLFLNYSSLCAAEADLLNLLKYIENGYVDDQSAAKPTINAPSGLAKRGNPIKLVSEFDTNKFSSSIFDCKAMIGPIQELRNYFKSVVQKQNNNNNNQQNNEYNSDNIQVQNGKDIFEIILIHTRSSQDKITQNSIEKYVKALEKEKKDPHLTFESGLNQQNLGIYIEKANKAIKDLSISSSHHGLETWVKFLEGLLDLWNSHNQFSIKARKPDNPTQFLQNTDVMSDYKLYFDLEDPENPQLNLACLNPSLNFQKILSQEPHCLLFTSGTLKPFDFWKTELQIPFSVILENKHVIDSKKQLFAAVIKGRPTKSSLPTKFKQNFNFSYDKRKDQDMILDLGLALVDLFQVIPNGVLVVFPSNQLMNQCRSQWSFHSSSDNNANSAQKIYNRLMATKFLYWEAKTNAETQSAMTDFRFKSKSQRGSAFFCVARGKISEGIDFADEFARAVILVGLPYPPLKNIKIQVKKDYLNQQHRINSQRINGNDWYVQEAIRAMNQSIGRVIRHVNDWGSVIFLDERFSYPDTMKYMPQWCQTQSIELFDQALIQLSQFFNERKQMSRSSSEQQRKQLLQKKKEQEDLERCDQSSNGSLTKLNGQLGAQKRVFDFQSIKNQQNQTQKQVKYLKQNVLLSETKEEKDIQQQKLYLQQQKQPIQNMQETKKPPFFVSQLSDDEDNNNIPNQIVMINTQKQTSFQAKEETNNNLKPGQFDFSKPIKIKSFEKQKSISTIAQTTLNSNSNIMSMKNSIYSNNVYFEF